MKMNFCLECNKLIIPKKENGKTILICERCGLNQEVLNHEGLVVKSEIHKKSEKANGVVSEENTSACFGHKCKKCGFDKAELIDMGVFISDEDNLVFIKCGKCGFKERVGRRTS